MKSTYLLIDIGVILFPFLFSFHKGIKFYDNWRYLFPALFITGSIFIVWDGLFTHFGIWSFSNNYTLGIRFFYLPIEEWLFFLSIPYACVFVYEIISRRIEPFRKNRPFIEWIAIGFAVFFSVIAICYFNRMYTSITFGLTAISLYIMVFLHVRHLLPVFISYCLLLIPFLLVNGMLTGSFLNRIIVSYADKQNLGIRVLSIPVEDAVYGFLHFLWTVVLYEYFRFKRSNRLIYKIININ